MCKKVKFVDVRREMGALRVTRLFCFPVRGYPVGPAGSAGRYEDLAGWTAGVK